MPGFFDVSRAFWRQTSRYPRQRSKASKKTADLMLGLGEIKTQLDGSKKNEPIREMFSSMCIS